MHFSKRLTCLFAFHSAAALILHSLEIRERSKTRSQHALPRHLPCPNRAQVRPHPQDMKSCTYHLRRAKRTADNTTVTRELLTSSRRPPQISMALGYPGRGLSRGKREPVPCCSRSVSQQVANEGDSDRNSDTSIQSVPPPQACLPRVLPQNVFR